MQPQAKEWGQLPEAGKGKQWIPKSYQHHDSSAEKWTLDSDFQNSTSIINLCCCELLHLR